MSTLTSASVYIYDTRIYMLPTPDNIVAHACDPLWQKRPNNFASHRLLAHLGFDKRILRRSWSARTRTKALYSAIARTKDEKSGIEDVRGDGNDKTPLTRWGINANSAFERRLWLVGRRASDLANAIYGIGPTVTTCVRCIELWAK